MSQAPSRRSLLATLTAVLAGLFGISRASATQAAAPLSPPAPPFPPSSSTVMTYFYDNTGPSPSGSPCYTCTYDSANRLISCTDPVGRITTLVYDSDGNWLH